MPSPANTSPAPSRSFFTSSTNDRSAMAWVCPDVRNGSAPTILVQEAIYSKSCFTPNLRPAGRARPGDCGAAHADDVRRRLSRGAAGAGEPPDLERVPRGRAGARALGLRVARAREPGRWRADLDRPAGPGRGDEAADRHADARPDGGEGPGRAPRPGCRS